GLLTLAPKVIDIFGFVVVRLLFKIFLVGALPKGRVVKDVVLLWLSLIHRLFILLPLLPLLPPGGLFCRRCHTTRCSRNHRRCAKPGGSNLAPGLRFVACSTHFGRCLYHSNILTDQGFGFLLKINATFLRRRLSADCRGLRGLLAD